MRKPSVRDKQPFRPRRKDRAGLATAELAVCLPILLLLVFGSIECSGIIFVKQTLSAAAYEGARVAVLPESTNGDINSRVHEVLNARHVKHATIDVSPNNVRSAKPGSDIEVTVTAPSGTNRFLTSTFLKDVMITSKVVMMKE